MLQRLLATSSSDKASKKEEVIESCEDIVDGQPNNPYTEVLILENHSDIIRILLPINDRRFVSAGDDNKAVIWEVQYGKRIASLEGHTHPITCLLVVPSDTGEPLIISGSSDRNIRMWDSESGQCLNILTEHRCSIRAIQSVAPSIFCAAGEKLSLWTDKGKMLCCVDNCASEDIDLLITIKQDRIMSAADKDLFAYKYEPDPEQDLYRLSRLKQLQSIHREAIHCLVNISTSCFASGSLDGMIVIWSASTLQPVRQLNNVVEYEGSNRRFPYSVQCLMCVQERYLFAAIGCGFYVFDVSAVNEALIVQKKAAHFSKITCMGFASEGELLVTGSEDKSLRLWGRKSTSGESMAVTTMERFTGLVSQDLHQLVKKSPWEPLLLGECLAHGGSVQAFLDFDHEGIVSCGADGIVIVWKNAEMQRVRRNQTVRKLLLSTDGIV